jgi:hypothetical protein
MSRFFTLEQAEGLIPQVERAIRDAIALKNLYQEAEAELQNVARRITMLGGAQVNREQLAAQRNQREDTATQLKDAIETIQSYGCLVKDLDIGLIDFPTLYHDEEVYLCWKLGENGIRFWHGVDEGFRGRKPIDREFLEHHRGDRAN